MEVSKAELTAILLQYNPWWIEQPITDLPPWKRAVFHDLWRWVSNPPAHRAVLVSGARQVGKTTLIMQAVQKLLTSGTRPGNILYATFDHPAIKIAGIDAVLAAWRDREPQSGGPQYLFLDEAQFIPHWGTWIKHQVDFDKQRRIIFTGSAMPLIEGQESGVGRWHAIRLTTLSFYEYIRLRQTDLPALPQISSLKSLFSWDQRKMHDVSLIAAPYTAEFHQYLLRGGFPQTALVTSITQAQKLLREDVVDKALKRDMTALFGVRRVLDLEMVFYYLCSHDGDILDAVALGNNLQVVRQTAQRYVELLEAMHLVYRLQPYGYGKEVLRGRSKLYLADAAIAPAVLHKGLSVLDDPDALGVAAEACVLKHLFARYYQHNVRFTYWRKQNREVDLIAEIEGETIPFEVKYRHTKRKHEGLDQFCTEHNVTRAYVVTKSLQDLRVETRGELSILNVPASLLCYWMGAMEGG